MGYLHPVQQQQYPDPTTEWIGSFWPGSGTEDLAAAGAQHNIPISGPAAPGQRSDAAEATVDQQPEEDVEYCGIHSKYGFECFCKDMFPKED
jgi:hypothetical protein